MFTQAREDLQSYLKLAPNADDAGVIREQVVRLGNQDTCCTDYNVIVLVKPGRVISRTRATIMTKNV